MEQLNEIHLVGRVGNVRLAQLSSTKAAKITLATSCMYKNRDGAVVEEVTWTTVSAFESSRIKDLDKIVKGSILEVQGRLRQVRYTDSYGTDHNTCEVVARSLQLIPSETPLQAQSI